MSRKQSKERRKSSKTDSNGDGEVPSSCSKIVEDFITNHPIAIFSKSWCNWSTKAKEAFDAKGLNYGVMELDIEPDGANLQKALKQISGQKTVPNIYINNRHIGGYSDLVPIIEAGILEDMCSGTLKECEYDLVVIGGGSGGISAAKEAAKLGKKVALCDFVVPTPLGTKWGLGGTCVNVGCIPKKLMHRAAVIRQDMADALAFGWASKTHNFTHDWGKMVGNIQQYIRSLNFGYRKTLMENNVKYFNQFASFVDKHTLKLTSSNGIEEMQLTATNFVIATGGRPKYPNIKNAKELCITSDDLFSMTNNPGRTLVVGASYVALECAGFLAGLGYDVTVMVRSILLRGFDQQIAGLIEAQMTKYGVKFIKNTVPTSFEKDKKHGTITVKGQGASKFSEVFDTVLLAIGRDPCTDKLNLSGIGIKTDPNTQKIVTDDGERTSVPNIFAVGDVAHGRPELTPPAIQAGKLLALRLYGLKTELMDYKNIATTVFTPCEYGCVGYTEEDAIKEFGQDKVETYHQEFAPLEHSLNEADHVKSYAKLIVRKEDQDEYVIGVHIFSPNAGEIIQGYALGVKLGAKKTHFDGLVGIHPTIAETFTTLHVTKSSGMPAGAAGC